MVELCVSSEVMDEPGIGTLVSSLRDYLRGMNGNQGWGTAPDECAHVVLTRNFRDAPFRVLSPWHVVVSLRDAGDIAGYVGIEILQYLELCIVLAGCSGWHLSTMSYWWVRI